ncbi:MAG: STAS domain-containing protein [Deltaproteobacteria bacterium]|nr:STAS domain-containing protein [Deltaproteobacteria bacterium]
MEHTVREEQGNVVVSFKGDVDLEHSPKAREVLLGCVEEGQDVFVDLSAVSYIDSSGVASLVEAFQASKKKGTRFALVAVNAAAMRVLELARLDKVFTIHESLSEGISGGA